MVHAKIYEVIKQQTDSIREDGNHVSLKALYSGLTAKNLVYSLFYQQRCSNDKSALPDSISSTSTDYSFY